MPPLKAQGAAVSGGRRNFDTNARPRLRYPNVGLLQSYGKTARKTRELLSLLIRLEGEAAGSNREPTKRTSNEVEPDLTQLIIDQYRLGASTYQLATWHDLRRNTVRDLLRRNGVEIREGNTAALTDEQKAEIRRRAAAGEPRKRLMRDFGVSESTIRRALRS